MDDAYDVVIVGAGAVGCAIARQLALDYPQRNIVVFEKLWSAGLETSSRNSGVLHSGFHQNPKFLKSRFAREGSRLAVKYLMDKGFMVMNCGMIIAISPTGIVDGIREWRNLAHLLRYGRKQRIGFEFLTPKRVRELEPNINAIGGILIPEVCVIDSLNFVNSLRWDAEANGVRFVFNQEVKNVNVANWSYRLETGNEEFFARSVVNSAGLYADDVARLAGFNQYKVYPWRGEYYEIVGDKRNLVRHLVNPVLPPSQGKGAHFGPRVDGRLYFGPNARLVPSKDYYEEDKTPVEIFAQAIQRFCPAIKEENLLWAYSGIRPKITDSPQESDFIVGADSRSPLWINLIGIESPGLSSAMAIANHISRMIRFMT